jgi:hypothetical protein
MRTSGAMPGADQGWKTQPGFARKMGRKVNGHVE